MDTLDANLHLGFPADAREYFAVAAILKSMGISEIRLLSNNPDKQEQLTKAGINVAELIGLQIAPREQNSAYLRTKQVRFGHHLDLPVSQDEQNDPGADAYHGAQYPRT